MLLQRILTVVFGAPIVIGVILCPVSSVFKIFVILCLLIALMEYGTIVGFSRMERYATLVLGFFHLIYLLFCPEAGRDSLAELSGILIATFGFHCVYGRNQMSGIAQRVGLTLLGIFYIGTLGATVGLLRTLPGGVFWIFSLLGMTWLNDTFAYFAGHKFGRHRMAPHLSPGKTWEGFLGGFFGSLLGLLLFWFLFGRPIPLARGVLMVLLVGIFGPLGDLSESLIKRSFGVKDSGNIIPGHGGMLDRIDALLFTAPVVYWFALFS